MPNLCEYVPALIVNADDFGLTAGVNRSVLELLEADALTSATLMVNGSAALEAVRIAQSAPRLGVGCHVVLIDGSPVLNPSSIASLVSTAGRFPDSLPRFAAAVLSGAAKEQHIEAEATAQIRRLLDAGMTVDHVDTHKHTHMFPPVARALMRAAVTTGVRSIRNPFEPGWSASLATAAPTRRLQVRLLRAFRHSFFSSLKEFGLVTTSGALGVAATGTLDDSPLSALLAATPAGAWELVCHPGYHDADLEVVRTRLQASRRVEHTALLKHIPAAVASGTIRLIRFSDLG